MARNKTGATYANSFEVQVQRPLDNRQRVTTRDELLIAANWDYGYLGMIVSVYEDTIANNGIYRLKEFPVTELTNWEKVGANVPLATTTTPGIVKPDGSTIVVDANGVISASAGGVADSVQWGSSIPGAETGVLGKPLINNIQLNGGNNTLAELGIQGTVIAGTGITVTGTTIGNSGVLSVNGAAGAITGLADTKYVDDKVTTAISGLGKYLFLSDKPTFIDLPALLASTLVFKKGEVVLVTSTEVSPDTTQEYVIKTDKTGPLVMEDIGYLGTTEIDLSEYATKEYVSAAIGDKVTESEVGTIISDSVNTGTIANALGLKANIDAVYTKAEITAMDLADKPFVAGTIAAALVAYTTTADMAVMLAAKADTTYVDAEVAKVQATVPVITVNNYLTPEPI